LSVLTDALSLADYGWSAHFGRAEAELALTGALTGTTPARVLAVHRDALHVGGPGFTGRIVAHAITPGASGSQTGGDVPAAGDWLAIDPATQRIVAVYPRASLFQRRGAGTTSRPQAIAANIDTVLIVTSANQDFNVARIERYLAVAHEARVVPVLVITKADLADPAPYVEQARAAAPGLVIETANTRDAASLAGLAPWLKHGQTIALLGSSGVGKSTIANTLLGHEAQATGGIREDDAKGRHTTTVRALMRLPGGAWLLDTPGMRELQLVDVDDGVATVFADLTEMARGCRFGDCAHVSEPGCAVQAAIAAGQLDPGRLDRFRKLDRESSRNREAAWEARARVRRQGRQSGAAKSARRSRET
jgi:ribosome biogenesis GTPase / thiamine phosphate phosphatase